MHPLKTVAVTWIALGLLSVACNCFSATDPLPNPILRMETGTHFPAIRSIAADSAGQIILTCSNDKTARLWRLGPGPKLRDAPEKLARVEIEPLDVVLLRVLRPPIDSGEEGELYACALSRDGRIAAVGGHTGYRWDKKCSIYLFNTATGKMLRRIEGLPNTVKNLRFSPAGNLLAVTVAGKNGMEIRDCQSGELLAYDRGYGDSTYGLDWHAKAGLVTSCSDGAIRLYNISTLARAVSEGLSALKPSAIWRGPDGAEPFSVRFSPDGSLIAAGYYCTPQVTVHQSDDLNVLFRPSCIGIDEGIEAVAWLPDVKHPGNFYLAAGGTWSIYRQHYLRSWRDKGRGEHADRKVSGDTLLCLEATPNGRLLFSSPGNWGAIDVLGLNGVNFYDSWEKTLDACELQTMDFRLLKQGMVLSEDAETVGFGCHPMKGAIPPAFDLGQRLIYTDEDTMRDLILKPLKSEAMGMKLEEWENKPNPRLNRQKLDTDGLCRSYAFSHDGSKLLLGCDRSLECYSPSGSLLWRTPVTCGAWSVNASSQSDLVVAACGDGTIRWHRGDTGKELLAFFPHADHRRWVLWTPEGYYDCYPGSESLIGWHVNRGKYEAADFFPASRFRNVFYRPDIIAKVLNTLDTEQAVRQADLALRESDPERQFAETDPNKLAAVIKSLSPPVVEELHANMGQETKPTIFGEVVLKPTDTAITIRYRVRQTGDKPPVKATIRFNGRLVNGNAPLPQSGEWAMVEVPLPKAMSGELSVFAELENRLSVSEPAVLRIKREPGSVQPRKPRLYLVAAGVAKPAPQSGFPDLYHAAQDATRMVEALSAQRGKIYERDEAADKERTVLLIDAEATTESVCAALKKVASAAEPEDVMVFFFAGHGDIDAKQGYYLVTHDTKEKQPALTGKKLSELLEPIRARTLMVLETCHAGGAFGGSGLNLVVNNPKDLAGLTNQLASAEEGTVVIASSGVQEVSREDKRNGGLLTQAILECVRSGIPSAKSNTSGDATVTCVMLQESVRLRVPEMVDETMEKNPPNIFNDRGVFRQPMQQEKTQQHPVCLMPKGVPDFAIARP